MPDQLKTLSLYLLKIPALLYTVIMTVRNLAYDLLPGLSHRVALPIICVGNLTTGGTGKTPMVAYLTRYFQTQGLRAAVLSRGYGRKDRKTQKVITPDSKLNTLNPAEIGDEALMLCRQLDDITLVLDADRVRGAETIHRENLADIIILDDGFQHRRLRRDFNIVMIDSQRVFGSRSLLPAGPLREPLSGLRRADAVIFNKFDQCHPEFYAQTAAVINHTSSRKLFRAAYQYREFRPIDGDRSLTLAEMRKLNPFAAVSGLANDDYFIKQLTAAGLDIEKSLSFKDHHVYTDKDIVNIKNICRDLNLITSAKDADKLKAVIGEAEEFRHRIWIAEIELKLEDENRFFALLTKISS
jgi:tetraacyldisaccharide 4'-kinase